MSKVPIPEQIRDAIRKYFGPLVFLWSIALLLFRTLHGYLNIHWHDKAMLFVGFSKRMTDWMDGLRYESGPFVIIMLLLNLVAFVSFFQQQRSGWLWLMIAVGLLVFILLSVLEFS